MRAVLSILTACLVACVASESHADIDRCLQRKGTVAIGAFGSFEQITEMKKHTTDVEACPVVGWSWALRLPNGPVQSKLLLWDRNSQKVYRLASGLSGSRWERWTGASVARVLADDPSDGFDLASYISGAGTPSLAGAAAQFLKESGWK